MRSEVSLPIQVCKPRCFVIEPRISRFQATALAGAHSDRMFRIRSPFKRPDVNVRLIQRRLVPLWSVRCRSRFHYDRLASYTIPALDADAVEITIQGPDGGQLVLPVSQESRRERLPCMVWRDV